MTNWGMKPANAIVPRVPAIALNVGGLLLLPFAPK